MLSAQTVLVVEEEFLIALDIQRMVEARNASQTIFARSAVEAMLQQPSWGDLGMAIVEVRPGAHQAVQLCKLLLEQGVAVVVMSGDSVLRRGVPELPGTPVVIKPMSETDLANALSLALARNQSE